MIWLLVLILLLLVFGLGTVLEAAFWMLAIIALVVIIGGVAMRGSFAR